MSDFLDLRRAQTIGENIVNGNKADARKLIKDSRRPAYMVVLVAQYLAECYASADQALTKLEDLLGPNGWPV